MTSTMANHWAQKGWTLTLLTFDDDSTPPFYELDSRIRLIPLGIYRSSSGFPAKIVNNLKRIYMLRRAIRDSRPEVVISFSYLVNILVLLSTRGLALPLIISDHNDPLMNPIIKPWRLLHKWAYNFRVRIVVQTERALAALPARLREKTIVIPNPVPPIRMPRNLQAEIKLPNPTVVSLGKFYHQKGYDLLLMAFAMLKDSHPDWSLTIIGDGPLRRRLESLRDELGLVGRVHFRDPVSSTHIVLQQADLFVMPSRWEGWPTILLEALSCGIPVIAADCRCGPREIIRDGVDGVLVPPEDVEALANAMGRLISDESERNRLASRAAEVKERFALDNVMGKWEELLSSVSKNETPAPTSLFSATDYSSHRS